MTNTVIGVYDTFAHAQSAKQKLLASGFTNNDIQMQPSSDTSATDSVGSNSQSNSEHEGGTIASFFREIFGASSDQDHVDRYAEATRRGSFVVTVDAANNDRRDLATSILEQFDPVDIDERASKWQAAGWQQHDPAAPRLTQDEISRERTLYGVDRDDTNNTQRTIPVIEEELQVGKRQVQRGGIRVVQRVINTPVEETISLREEHVTIERHPVNTPATAHNLEAFKEESFELREMAEEAVVSKTARIVEEVVIGKEISENQKTISDNVRRTDVEVEQLAGSNSSTQQDSLRKNNQQR